MPTTANFSLEYPDDNSSVDIAGHFETLADDVDEAINTRLALTGGTLTGALVGTLTTDSSSSTTGAFKTAGGMGIAKALYVGTTLNVTGATTLTGDLTISKATAALSVTSTSGASYISSSRVAGQFGGLRVETSGALRWLIAANSASESGSNAGSDLVIGNYNDAGANIGTPLTITRSTGAFTLTGDLAISKASPVLWVSASSGHNYWYIDRAAGSSALLRMRTGTSSRWAFGVNGTSESGSNAGSNFEIYRYSDAGSAIDAPLSITRSTGLTTLSSLTVSGTTTLTGATTANGDITISKASPALNLNTSAIDQTADINFKENGSLRWWIRKDSSAEDLTIYRTSDGGSSSGVVQFKRDTGKVLFASVGATAGLELGTSGPRVMSGTGSPEGVVTAPVGSQWIDTAATTGAVAWRKATGAGSSGWVVSEGDTGWRDITSLATANAGQTLSKFNIRRAGNAVHVAARLAQSTDATRFTLLAEGVWPTGFATPTATGTAGVPIAGVRNQVSYGYIDSVIEIVPIAGYSDVYYRQNGSGNYIDYYGSFITDAAWPASLPGSAA